MRHGRQLLRITVTVLSVVLAAFGVNGAAQAATATGTLVVVVTDSVGAPLPGARLTFSNDGGTTWRGIATTSPSTPGTYSLKAAPGGYEVRIAMPSGLVDYVPGQSTPAGAQTYQVLDGQSTTVNEQLSQSGNVQISLVDRITGAPVSDGCVSMPAFGNVAAVCNHADGRYTFVAVPLGQQTVNVSGTWTHWSPSPVSITVAAGFGDYPVRLDPAAAVQTVVQAADDPTLHPEFCAQPVYPTTSLLNWTARLACSDPTTGVLTLGPLPAVPTQLFAMPADAFDTSHAFNPVYGAQWVGASGGTGDQRQALTISATTGTVTAVPPIRVDHAGSISGVASDPYGDVTTGVYISPVAPQVGLSYRSDSGLAVYLSLGSTYTLTGLGPYAWPVDFANYDRGAYAEQWSGGAPNRYAATPVQVNPGQTSTANATLVWANGVTGVFNNPPRAPANNAWVMATNAKTGDWTGLEYVYGNKFDIAGLSSDPVRLTYQPGNGVVYEYPGEVPTSGPSSMGIVLSRIFATEPRVLPSAGGGPYGRIGSAGPPAPSVSETTPTVSSMTAPGHLTAPDPAALPRKIPAKPWFF